MITGYLVPWAVATLLTIATFFVALVIHSRRQERMYRRSLSPAEFEVLLRDSKTKREEKFRAQRVLDLEKKWMDV